ncbi:hypothetical protein F3N42_03595 [Marinihelvus fidelis]|uniref:Uncharacterized protein n=1 Tax=Marinihelvus fidelis TaxID=2613842 RepID=A0A5N0THW1_9GAMM|nr:hypothetical protein [Marinihelvus fidelis]KAA9133446.1 hypothetical protein F3N42_03595 [Marinihelvus fidelis]
MSEERAIYRVDRAAPDSLEAFKSRPCALPFHDPGYTAPKPSEIDALIQLAGWSQVETAKIAGVNFKAGKGSTTVRKWRTPVDSSEHRGIPYAAWRIMLAAAGVVTIDPADYTRDQLMRVAE